MEKSSFKRLLNALATLQEMQSNVAQTQTFACETNCREIRWFIQEPETANNVKMNSAVLDHRWYVHVYVIKLLLLIFKMVKTTFTCFETFI